MGTDRSARTRSLWRGVRRRADVETEMQDEFRQHVELRAEDPLDEVVRRRSSACSPA